LCGFFILGRREIVIAAKNKALLKRKIRQERVLAFK
jgi:hypothetical protein